MPELYQAGLGGSERYIVYLLVGQPIHKNDYQGGEKYILFWYYKVSNREKVKKRSVKPHFASLKDSLPLQSKLSFS